MIYDAVHYQAEYNAITMITFTRLTHHTIYSMVLNICLIGIIIKLKDINNWIILEWPSLEWPSLKDSIWVPMCSILNAKLWTIKNWVTLTEPLKVTQGQRSWCHSHMISNMCSILNICLSGTKTKLLTIKNWMTLKWSLKVAKGQWSWNHMKALMFLYVLYTICLMVTKTKFGANKLRCQNFHKAQC